MCLKTAKDAIALTNSFCDLTECRGSKKRRRYYWLNSVHRTSAIYTLEWKNAKERKRKERKERKLT